MKDRYKGYFKRHYRSKFTKIDIDNYRHWFYPQWKYITKKLKFKNKENVLEIGAGLGGFYSFLEEYDVNYTGLEPDEQAQKFSNSYFKTNKFQSLYLEKFKSNKQYDKIFAFEVLEHMHNPSENIEKIYRLLKPGGIFCGTTPFPFYKNVVYDKTHVSVLHPENWKRLFMQEQFSSVEIYPMSFFPFIWRINKKLNLRMPFYVPFKGFVSTCLIIAKK